MERKNCYLICTICKRQFFTKTGFQLHNNEEHQEVQDTTIVNPVSFLVKECLNKSVEEKNCDGIIETPCINEEKYNDEIEFFGQSIKIQQENCKTIEPLQCLQSDNRYGDKILQDPPDITSIYENMQCQLCKKKFKSQTALTCHVQGVHEKIKPYQCQKCDKSFSQKIHFQNHVQGVHDKIKPFQCQQCKKTFSLIHILKRHIKGVHDQMKPYQCQKCNKSYSQKTHLQEHIQRVHEKIRPFACQQCNKGFSQKIHFQNHVQGVHEKINPFKCQKCNKSYSRKRNLQYHIQGVHEKN